MKKKLFSLILTLLMPLMAIGASSLVGVQYDPSTLATYPNVLQVYPNAPLNYFGSSTMVPIEAGHSLYGQCGGVLNETFVTNDIGNMVSMGLVAAGNNWYVLDQGWQDVDGNGNMIPCASSFPHGIKFIVDYAHANGVKLMLSVILDTAGSSGGPGYGIDSSACTKAAADMNAWGVDGAWLEVLNDYLFQRFSADIASYGRPFFIYGGPLPQWFSETPPGLGWVLRAPSYCNAYIPNNPLIFADPQTHNEWNALMAGIDILDAVSGKQNRVFSLLPR